MNNVPEYCKRQMLYGLDAVIVDSVLAVRKGLRTLPSSVSNSDPTSVLSSNTMINIMANINITTDNQTI